MTARAPPSSRHGSAPAVITAATVKAIAAAAAASAGKLMLALPRGAHREYPLAPGEADPALRGTRCFFHLETSCPTLADALKPPGFDHFGVDRINLYLSQDHCGAQLHFDTRTVIVVQLAGTKLWRFSERPAVPDPHRTFLAPIGRARARYGAATIAIPTRLESCVLRPGDWLMLPQATWHETYTFAGSASVTLAAPAPHSEVS